MKFDKATSETGSNSELATYDTFPIKEDEPRSSKAVPLIILVLTCIGSFSENFCYENPTPFQKQIEGSLQLSTTKYNMLFSFYYLPNIITPLLFGYLSDSCGRRIAITLSATLIVLGQFLFAVGISTRSFSASLTGRLLFGIGAEAYVVVVLECLSFWTFSFLAISMGIQSAAQRLGNTLNDFMLPYVYEATNNLPLQFWIGFIFAGVCLLSTIALVAIEYYSLKDNRQSQGETIQLSAIFNFPLLYWLLTLFTSFVYMGMISFNTIASGHLQTRFGLSLSTSGIILCIPLVMVIVGSIGFGFIIDRIGRYSTFSLIGSIGLTFVFALISLLPDTTPTWIICIWFGLYGLFNSLIIASVWPCVKFVVPEGLTSTAYGLCFSIEDAMLFLGPFITGVIIDTTKKYSGGYFWASVFFFALCSIATVFCVLLFALDYKKDRVLYDRHQTVLPIPAESITN